MYSIFKDIIHALISETCYEHEKIIAMAETGSEGFRSFKRLSCVSMTGVSKLYSEKNKSIKFQKKISLFLCNLTAAINAYMFLMYIGYSNLRQLSFIDRHDTHNFTSANPVDTMDLFGD